MSFQTEESFINCGPKTYIFQQGKLVEKRKQSLEIHDNVKDDSLKSNHQLLKIHSSKVLENK